MYNDTMPSAPLVGGFVKAFHYLLKGFAMPRVGPGLFSPSHPSGLRRVFDIHKFVRVAKQGDTTLRQAHVGELSGTLCVAVVHAILQVDIQRLLQQYCRPDYREDIRWNGLYEGEH